MGFRLVPMSVTLNDHERRNGHYVASFRRIRYVSGPINVKVVDNTPILCATKMK